MVNPSPVCMPLGRLLVLAAVAFTAIAHWKGPLSAAVYLPEEQLAGPLPQNYGKMRIGKESSWGTKGCKKKAMSSSNHTFNKAWCCFKMVKKEDEFCVERASFSI